MQSKDWLVVFSTLLSPLIAVQVSVFLQHRKDKRERRFQVFRALMATRAANLNPNHVEALNMIDVVFYGNDRKSKAVVEALKVYLDHLGQPTSNVGWGDRRVELLIDLLQKMATSLDYDFDKVTIKRTSYFPRGYGDAESETEQIRKSLLEILDGKRSFPMWISGITQTSGMSQQVAGADSEARSPIADSTSIPKV